MRISICKECKHEIVENDFDINVHYNNPETICIYCKVFHEKKIGDWYQTPDGTYHIKVEGNSDPLLCLHNWIQYHIDIFGKRSYICRHCGEINNESIL